MPTLWDDVASHDGRTAWNHVLSGVSALVNSVCHATVLHISNTCSPRGSLALGRLDEESCVVALAVVEERVHVSPAPAPQQLSLDAAGTPLIDVTFTVVDLETTGLSPERDAITEIGAVKLRAGEVIGELATFVDPREPIPGSITAITGITDAMVRGAPPIDVVLPTLLEFLAGSVFVAHNAPFDLSFIRASVARLYGDRFTPEVVDTARLARRLLAGELRSFKLANLASHFGASTTPNHRALVDARATADVLHGLIERAGSHGAVTLQELQELTRSRSDKAYRRRDLVADAPAAPGVYRFVGVDGEVLYVGKTERLDRRLRNYFGQDERRRIADLVRDTHSVGWVVTPTALEAEIRELRDIHSHRPRYNRRSMRPENTVHLALTHETLPRLSVVREPGRGHSWTVGPFTSRRVAELIADEVAAATSLRTCTTRLRRSQDHPACVLKDLGRCGAPCDATQTIEAYSHVVQEAQQGLTDPRQLLTSLRSQMRRAAYDQRFEHADELRKRLHTTAQALLTTRKHDSLTAVSFLVASRPSPNGTDVAVVRHGRLLATAVLPQHAHDDTIIDTATAIEATGHSPEPPSFEEVTLLNRWLSSDGVRIVHIAGRFTSQVEGGAALHATVDEARQLARALRHDQQRLDRSKVRRRSIEDEVAFPTVADPAGR